MFCQFTAAVHRNSFRSEEDGRLLQWFVWRRCGLDSPRRETVLNSALGSFGESICDVSGCLKLA